jgi:hypothetical protein
VREKLLHAIAWLTARHIAHFEAQQRLIAVIGSWFMEKAHPALFSFYQQAQEQQEELQELKALDAALEIKKLNTNEIGQTHWPDHAAIGLQMVAGVLIEQHDWEPEDVADFVDDLTEGHFSFNAFDEED